MLIALITMLLLGGSSTSVLNFIADTTDNVKIVMPKGEAQKAALGTLKAMKKRTSAHNKIVSKTAKEISKTLGDHEASVDDVQAIWATYYAEVHNRNSDMLDLRFELKEHISREEWQRVFDDADREHR